MLEKLDLKIDGQSDKNFAYIKQGFPSVITETQDENGKIVEKIDFEKLKQELSDQIIEGKEAYNFTWPGKKKAILEANTPTDKTLRPCREESVNFDTTENLYIEGDNLEVLKLLQNSYFKKVKMIYIDPPYNTGNDFIYNDKFTMDSEEYEEATGLRDEDGDIQFKQNKTSNPRYHSDWCTMMYSRLKLARNLLTDDGVIFISIDDNEVANMTKICNEIFGENNFVGILIHQRAKGGGQAKYIVKGHDYILVYGNNISKVSLKRKKVIQQNTYKINNELFIKNDDIVRKVFGKYDKSLGDRRCFYEQLIEYKGEDKKREIDKQIANGELFLEENKYGMHTICKYEKVSDSSSKLYSIIKVLSEEGKDDLEKLNINAFSYPKPVELIKQLVDSNSSEDDLILDFFSGSATTAHAVMQLNAEDGGKRKFILVNLPEECKEDSEAYKHGFKNICEIGKERIRRAGKKIKEEFLSKKDITEEEKQRIENLDIGFRVLKLDSNNMIDTSYRPCDIRQDLLSQLQENIKQDRSAEDLLYACFIKLPLELNIPYEIKDVDGFKIYIVNEDELVACFDKNITMKVVEAMADLKPMRVVFRDNSFATSADRINADQIFKYRSPGTNEKDITVI